MGIGGGSGGGGFKLEKTWRSTGVGTTTFNAPGNFNIPFGKYEVLVSGRGGSGNPNTPGNVASYNPIVPSTVSGSNPSIPSTIAGYNPIVPGNPTGIYNAGSGGTLAGYNRDGGNFAGSNPPTPGGFRVSDLIEQYLAPVPGAPGNWAGNYNPPVTGNLAGYNAFTPGTPGNALFNPPAAGFKYTTYFFDCEPTFGAYNLSIVREISQTFGGYRAYYDAPTTSTYFYYDNVCPAPQSGFVTFPPQGTPAGYNPPSSPSGGTEIYNPGTPGTAIYNAPNAPYNGEYTSFTIGPYFDNTCSAPFTYFQQYYQINNEIATTFYEEVTTTCTPEPGTPGNVFYNPISDTPFFNPYIPGNQNVNASTGGTANYNAAVAGTTNWNAVGGQNANYNAPAGGTAGAAANVLGVYFPGGNVGAVAPYVPPTVINRYIADDATYPISVPPGGYVTVQSK